MGNKDSNFISSKAFLIGIALLGLIGLAVLLLWRSPCDDIFAQTAPELKVNLKIIENEGAFAVSREKIQELSESAQKVGLHLKTCCYVLEVGSLTAQQFQQCIDKTSDYERQISIVAQQIKETVKVKEKGSADAVRSKIADINQAIETATGKALVLAQFVEKDLTQTAAASRREESNNEEIETETQPEEGKSYKEKESNNQIRDANVIEFGGLTRGVIASTEDRDYYKFRTPDQMSGKTRVILRKLSAGGFSARVDIYDYVESRIDRQLRHGDDSVTLGFDSAANSDYFILVTSPLTGGPYELEVREE